MKSVEYCHIADIEYNKTIVEANKIPYPAADEFVIIIDDINCDYPNGAQEVITALNTGLKIKPNAIFLESQFMPMGENIYTRLKEKKLVSEFEKRVLFNFKDHYGATVSFKVKFTARDEQKISCPMLVATSYLGRLGFYKLPTPVWGRTRVCQSLVNALPARYIQTESNALEIVKCFINDPQIQWILY